MSPNLSTGVSYARPQVVFGDGAYHRVVLEMRVDLEQRVKTRKKGGVQWIFSSRHITLHGVWVCVNMPPTAGDERLWNWDPNDEAVPPGREQAHTLVSERDPASHPSFFHCTHGVIFVLSA